MEATTYSDFRKNLKSYMAQVNVNSEALIVTNQNKDNIVVLSQSDYDNMVENAYIRSSKANLEVLNQSISQAKSGKTTEFDWKNF